MDGRVQLQFENRYIRKDGSVAHILWTARWLPERQLRLAVAHDITQRKRTERLHAAMYAISDAAHTAGHLHMLLTKVHDTLRSLVRADHFSIALRDEQHGTLGWAYSADNLHPGACGPLNAEHAGWCEQVIAQDRALVVEFSKPAAGPAVADDPATDGGGRFYWLGVPLPSQDGPMGVLVLQGPLRGDGDSEADKEVLEFVAAQVALVIERTQMHERLRRMAQYDQLTQLPNRALFNDRLHSAMARARREQTQLSLLFIDLDRFKDVNDTLGHAVGDALLKAVAQRLLACVRGSDTVARLGGDEFVVLLEGLRCSESPQAVAHKILMAFSQPFELQGCKLSTQPSIGMAMYPDHGAHESTLLSHADEAMYAAKRSGGNQFRFYASGLPVQRKA
jgi:diguanylate cyclase (GGDEF)-like protein